MIGDHQRVRVDEIEWSGVLGFVRLFDAFRMAVHPPKMILALMLVASLCVGGRMIDIVAGTKAYPGEPRQYANLPARDYTRWLEAAQRNELETTGVYAATQQFMIESCQRLVTAAAQLDFGLGGLIQPQRHHPYSVVGALRDMTVTLPCWLYHSHMGFLILFGWGTLALWALLGGAIARMAAMHASKDERPSISQALRFARSKWLWFLLTPIIPIVLAKLVALVPVVGGLALFNLPVLEVLGGALFFIPLACGVVITVLLLLLAASAPLLYPAIAVESTDGFDAISRAFSYVLGRPWRWLFYNLIVMVYGAITYLLVAMALFLAIWITHYCVGFWVFAETPYGVSRFEAVFPTPAVDQPAGGIDWSTLGWSGKAAAGMVSFWVYTFLLLLGAYAVSFYISANTWIYLLLRRAADGTPFDDVYTDPEPDAPNGDSPAQADTGDGPTPPPSPNATGEQPALTQHIDQAADSKQAGPEQ